jgi:DNA-binding GntR family transcriptional regulator
MPTAPSKPRRGAARATTAARVADRIRQAIVRGVLRAGDPLREAELVRRYRTNRLAFREALRRLEADGFVEVRPYRGAVVADLSPDGLIELTEMRGLVEPLALRLAIPRLRPDDLARAEAALDALERETDRARAGEHGWRFYAALYARSGRPVLIDTIRRLHVLARRHTDVGTAGERALVARRLRRQRAMLACLRAGRSDDAVEGLRRLISSAAGDLGSVLGGAGPATLEPVRGSRRRTPIRPA